MEILTEFDELQAALAKINMDESVLPYVNGRLVSENAYNKTQKILNCPEMISAHKYLYDLDMDQLTEDDENKINQLYDLGVKRGFIIDDLTKWDDEDNGEEAEEDVEVAVEQPIKPQNTLFKAKIPCWTIIYSATKDGDIKTGEAYSNAVSMSAAKADVNAKLSQCGYDNITILAIENCTDSPKASANISTASYGSFKDAVAEADEDDSSSDDSADDDSSDDSSDDDSSDDNSSDDSSSEDDSSDDSSSDDSTDDDSSDDSSSEDDSSDDDSSDDSSSDDNAGDDSDSTEDSDSNDSDSAEDSDSDDSEDASDDSDEDSDSDDSDDEQAELDPNEKAELRDAYRKTFKNTLVKCKFDTSFNDLTLEQKVKFFTELSKAWKKDNDPKDFMTDKEIEQLNNVVAQKTSSSDDDNNDDDSSDDSED